MTTILSTEAVDAIRALLAAGTLDHTDAVRAVGELIDTIDYANAVLHFMPAEERERVETFLTVQASGVVDEAVWRLRTRPSHQLRWERRDGTPGGIVLTPPRSQPEYSPLQFTASCAYMPNDGTGLVDRVYLQGGTGPEALDAVGLLRQLQADVAERLAA